MTSKLAGVVIVLALAAVSCGGGTDSTTDGATSEDAAGPSPDAGDRDAGSGDIDGGPGGVDSGPGDVDGGAAEDAGPIPVDSGPAPAPALQVVTSRDTWGNPIYGPADFSCLGTLTAPVGTGDAEITLLAEDFFSGDPVEGLTVQFFRDNVPTLDGTCTGTCQSVTTNASGETNVTGDAGAWYAYRVPAADGISDTPSPRGPHPYLTSVQINETTPATGRTATLNVVQVATQGMILSILGVTREAGTAVLTGIVSDCLDRPVMNAFTHVFDSSGEIELGFRASGPRAFYFNGHPDSPLPLGTRRRTHDDGLYGAANIPLPTDNTLRLELWGAITEGGTVEMLTCEEVQVNADGITVLDSGPDRADGPTSCSND